MIRSALVLSMAMTMLVGCKSEPRACTKLEELCGTKTETCRALRDDLHADFGQSAVDTLDGCVLQANTCSAAAGCATGEAAKATLAATADFMSAFVTSVSPATADECVKNAKSTAEAAGCRAGAAGKVLEASANEFADGLRKSR
jgi:hypothetical protein